MTAAELPERDDFDFSLLYKRINQLKFQELSQEPYDPPEDLENADL